MIAVTQSAQGPITIEEAAAAIIGILCLWAIVLLVSRLR